MCSMSGNSSLLGEDSLLMSVRSIVRNVCLAAARAMFRKVLNAAEQQAFTLRQQGFDLELRATNNIRQQELLHEQLAFITARIQRMELATGSRCATRTGEQEFQFARQGNRAELTRINYALMILREDYRRLQEQSRKLDSQHEQANRKVDEQQGVWLSLYIMLRDE